MSDQRADEDRKNTTRDPRKRPTPDPAGGGRETRSANYRDRPSDDGKHGDAGEEPNSGFPHED